MNIFEQYKALKSQLHYRYKDYDLEEILAIRIWLFCQFGCKARPSFRMRKDYGKLFSLEKANLFIYGKYGRKDHEYTFDCVYKKIEDSYDAIKLDKYPDIRFYSIKNYMLAFLLIFVLLGSRVMKFREKLYWWCCFCYILNTIDYLESMPEKKLGKLLCFSAIHEDENILKQYFKNHGAITYSMFHGTNIRQVHNLTIDCLTYENLYVDYCLPWGQYGKDEFIKTGISESTLIVVGYPREMKLQPLNSESFMKRCVVLMSRSQFEETDLKLMRQLSCFKNLSFSVKLHPSCDESKFADLCTQYGFELIAKKTLLSDCLNNKDYDFAIAVNTTSYYEALISGLPCLRYKDGDQYDMMMGDEHDEFEDENGFQESVAWIKETMCGGGYETIRQQILQYCLGYGIDNYREVLI